MCKVEEEFRAEMKELDLDNDSIEEALSIDSHLKQYLKQIQATELMASELQTELIKLYRQTGNREYRDRVISSNLRFVVYKCKKYFTNKSWFDPMDIIAVGNEALVVAAEKFDCNYANGFLAYAGVVIDSRVSEYVHHGNDNIAMSKESYRLKYKINQIYEEYKELNLKKPSYAEIADILRTRGVLSANSISEDLVRIIVEYDKTKSLNEYIAESSNNVELGDTIVDTDASFETQIENKIMLSQIVSCLTERELQIIQLRYTHSLSFEDIGRIFNIKRSTAKQAEKKAIEKLRKYCTA